MLDRSRIIPGRMLAPSALFDARLGRLPYFPDPPAARQSHP